ncbi:carbohydrate sulfotransferase 10-like isoform X2 [Leptopilina boulardi]|uniref:carbohydrate sulfotransferase 10-like isoform X2 n=1 Tax=Leptopilina boulardi TaxID=63433 RepID=UPI0021F67749|nr:carbohydrate sulfotransferase 10-like isoform X2 [Leptopilina boulardi]
MSRFFTSQLVRIFYFLLICGGIYIILKFLLLSRKQENLVISDLKNLQQFINQIEETNVQRITLVKKICEKYNLDFYDKRKNISKHPSSIQYKVFYIERSHNISLCPIYKSGSTTWIHNLCSLMGISEDELLSGKELMSTIARRVIPRLDYPEAEKAMKETIKLMVVRHPFERLLSAYRDKLENTLAGRENFQKEYGTIIVQKYRDKNFPSIRENQVIRMKETPGPAVITVTITGFHIINIALHVYLITTLSTRLKHFGKINYLQFIN